MAAAARRALGRAGAHDRQSGRHAAAVAPRRRRRRARRCIGGAGVARAGRWRAALAFGVWQWAPCATSRRPPATSAPTVPPDGGGRAGDRGDGARRHPDDRPAGRSASTCRTRQTNSRTPTGRLVGFDVDLMNAVAKTLGLVPEYREHPFESIIPSVQGGEFNVGMSSFTDTQGARGAGRLRHVLPGGHAVGAAAGIARRSERRRAGCGSGWRRDHPGNRGDARARATQCVAAGAAGSRRRLRQSGRSDRGADQRRDRRDVGRFAGDGVRDQAQQRRAGAGRRDLRLRALRLAGAQGVGAWPNRCGRRSST